MQKDRTPPFQMRMGDSSKMTRPPADWLRRSALRGATGRSQWSGTCHSTCSLWYLHRSSPIVH